MAWRLAHSLEQFRAEVNALWPGRDKHSDGSIGDLAHQHQRSDHDPNAANVVCAFDLDVDLDGTDDGLDDVDIDWIAETLRARRDPRIAFAILKRRIFRGYDKPGIPAFTWSPYTGADAHVSHLHLSVGQGPEGNRTGNYDDRAPWGLTKPHTAVPHNVPVPPLPKRKPMCIYDAGNAGLYLWDGAALFGLKPGEPDAFKDLPHFKLTPRLWELVSANHPKF